MVQREICQLRFFALLKLGKENVWFSTTRKQRRPLGICVHGDLTTVVSTLGQASLQRDQKKADSHLRWFFSEKIVNAKLNDTHSYNVLVPVASSSTSSSL